jgi:hypothetical protein
MNNNIFEQNQTNQPGFVHNALINPQTFASSATNPDPLFCMSPIGYDDKIFKTDLLKEGFLVSLDELNVPRETYWIRILHKDITKDIFEDDFFELKRHYSYTSVRDKTDYSSISHYTLKHPDLKAKFVLRHAEVNFCSDQSLHQDFSYNLKLLEMIYVQEKDSRTGLIGDHTYNIMYKNYKISGLPFYYY